MLLATVGSVLKSNLNQGSIIVQKPLRPWSSAGAWGAQLTTDQVWIIYGPLTYTGQGLYHAVRGIHPPRQKGRYAGKLCNHTPLLESRIPYKRFISPHNKTARSHVDNS